MLAAATSAAAAPATCSSSARWSGPSRCGLVRMRLSGVNPTDWKSRAREEPRFPFQVPNQDGVGVVEAVGAGVDEARIW